MSNNNTNNIWLGQAINLATAECLHKGLEDDFKAFLVAVLKHYQRIEMVQGTSLRDIAELLGKSDIVKEMDKLADKLK